MLAKKHLLPEGLQRDRLRNRERHHEACAEPWIRREQAISQINWPQFSTIMNPEDLPEPLRSMLGLDPRAEQINEMLEKRNHDIEQEIFMPLWAELGDKSNTYWEAVNAVSDLRSLIKKFRNTYDASHLSWSERRAIEAFMRLIEKELLLADEIAAIREQ